MLVTGGPDTKKTPEFPASPADVFAPQRFPRLMEIKLQAPVLHGLPHLPLFTLSLAAIGLLFVFSRLAPSFAESPVPSAGLLVLVLCLPVYLLERYVLWKTIKNRASLMKPCVSEIEVLRKELYAYMTDLDKRTLRYFHCVTNSKVTTYFMLRQIENSMAELLVEFDRLFRVTSQENLFGIQERLRGTLDYRDGFVFNSGKLLHCPVAFLPSRIHELVNELERGIGALESEIENFRDQISGTNADPDRQIGLYLDGVPAEDVMESHAREAATPEPPAED